MENQILDENLSQSSEITFDERVKNVLTNGYSFELGKYISTGSKILSKNLSGYIRFLLVILAITAVCNDERIKNLLSNDYIIQLIVPLANSFIISPVLFVGFSIMSFRISKDKSTVFGKFFGGFKFVGQLALLNLLTILIFAIVVVPYILIALGFQFSQIIELLKNTQSGDEDPVLVAQFILGFIYKLIPLFFICLIVSVCFSFAQYIVVFGKKGAMDALSISAKIIWKRFISMLLFLIVIGLINILGAICLLVGLLYTIPLSMCAMYAAYEHIVGTNSSDIED